MLSLFVMVFYLTQNKIFAMACKTLRGLPLPVHQALFPMALSQVSVL